MVGSCTLVELILKIMTSWMTKALTAFHGSLAAWRSFYGVAKRVFFPITERTLTRTQVSQVVTESQGIGLRRAHSRPGGGARAA